MSHHWREGNLTIVPASVQKTRIASVNKWNKSFKDFLNQHVKTKRNNHVCIFAGQTEYLTRLCCTGYLYTNLVVWINAWINNYIHYFIWDVITYQCPNFIVSLREPALKLCYVRVIASHNCMWTLSLIDALNSIIAIWRNSITTYIKQLLTGLHCLGFGSRPLWQCMCWMNLFENTYGSIRYYHSPTFLTHNWLIVVGKLFNSFFRCLFLFCVHAFI